LRSPRGYFYDLDAVFEELNTRFFHGLMARPRMSWSQTKTRRILGHYDPAHNAIIISRVFDHFAVPQYVLEYIVYHEMLHLKHPVKLRGSRRCVHSAEFQAEEKLFPHMAIISAHGRGECVPEAAVDNPGRAIRIVDSMIRLQVCRLRLTRRCTGFTAGRSSSTPYFRRVIQITYACEAAD